MMTETRCYTNRWMNGFPQATSNFDASLKPVIKSGGDYGTK